MLLILKMYVLNMDREHLVVSRLEFHRPVKGAPVIIDVKRS